jgi:hypothetical protein
MRLKAETMNLQKRLGKVEIIMDADVDVDAA